MNCDNLKSYCSAFNFDDGTMVDFTSFLSGVGPQSWALLGWADSMCWNKSVLFRNLLSHERHWCLKPGFFLFLIFWSPDPKTGWFEMNDLYKYPTIVKVTFQNLIVNLENKSIQVLSMRITVNNRCGRVMADNIAYAKFRKTLLIW